MATLQPALVARAFECAREQCNLLSSPPARAVYFRPLFLLCCIKSTKATEMQTTLVDVVVVVVVDEEGEERASATG